MYENVEKNETSSQSQVNIQFIYIVSPRHIFAKVKKITGFGVLFLPRPSLFNSGKAVERSISGRIHEDQNTFFDL